MKLRMYLRGLGLGMIVTALVMTFGLKTNNNIMTDAEIRQRAKELGMVDESTTLKQSSEPKEEAKEDTKAEPKEEVKEDTKAEAKEEVKEDTKAEAKEESKTEKNESAADTGTEPESESKTETKTDTDAKADKDAKVDAKSDTDAKTDAKTDTKAENVAKVDAKSYTLSIQGGYSSDRVAKILADAGLVESAASFDKYLCENGYDHKISVGTYTILPGYDYASIAKLITHSN